MTGLAVVDAVDLEENEAPIDDEVYKHLRNYGQLFVIDDLLEGDAPVSSDYSSRLPDRKGLMATLTNALGSDGSKHTSIPIKIENAQQEAISRGIGYLQVTGPTDIHSTKPVYISEPLVLQALRHGLKAKNRKPS